MASRWSTPRHLSGLPPALPARAPGHHRAINLRRAAFHGVLFSLVLFWGPLLAAVIYVAK